MVGALGSAWNETIEKLIDYVKPIPWRGIRVALS